MSGVANTQGIYLSISEYNTFPLHELVDEELLFFKNFWLCTARDINKKKKQNISVTDSCK